jgi:hypothetical protein
LLWYWGWKASPNSPKFMLLVTSEPMSRNGVARTDPFFRILILPVLNSTMKSRAVSPGGAVTKTGPERPCATRTVAGAAAADEATASREISSQGIVRFMAKSVSRSEGSVKRTNSPPRSA